MRFSLRLPTDRVGAPEEFVTASAIAEITRAAAGAGFSAVNVTDHPAPDTRWLDHGGHHALDPFTTLAVAAAADPEVRLHTNIYVAAYRNPFLGANQVLSLHVLSGGRVVLGVAAGYLKAEFRATGVDFEHRGELLDDALEVLGALASGDDVAMEGPGWSARGVRMRPVPPGGTPPPIWIGGNSATARRRAARHDGWAPFHTSGIARTARTAPLESVEQLAEGIAEVRALLPEDRGDRPFDVCWSDALVSDPRASVDERCSRLEHLSSLGVTWMTADAPGATRAEMLEGIEAFGRDVISAAS